MKKTFILFIVGLLAVVSLVGCSKDIVKKDGISDTGLYVNNKYGFQFQLPALAKDSSGYKGIFNFLDGTNDPEYLAQFGIALGGAANLQGSIYTKKSTWANVAAGKDGFEKIKINNHDALTMADYGTANYWFINTVFFGDKYIYVFQFSNENKDQKYIDAQNAVLQSFDFAQIASPVATTTAPVADQVTAKEPIDPSTYNQWKLPQQIIDANKNDFKNSKQSDCIGLMNGHVEGGDLLSTLIIDDDARKLMDLNAYSSEYVLKLENAIVKATHEKYNSDLYAFSACHLSPGIDVVAGILWPTGKARLQAAGKFKGDEEFNFGEKKVLVVVNNFSPIFFEDVRTLNRTATGAEVFPCRAKLKDNQNVLWTCFMGLHFVGDSVDGSNMTEWTLPLNGGVPMKRAYVDFN